MSEQTKAWAVVTDKGLVILRTVRSTRSGAIYEWASSSNPKFWRSAKRYGMRCVRVTITEDNRNE